MKESRTHSPLDALDREDLRGLIGLDAQDILGRILQLNQAPRYHNHLNAIELVVCIAELRSLKKKRK